MKEHRLIERTITLLKIELQKSKKSLEANTEFIRFAIDFFKTYADKTHHGKEEDILFKALSKRNLSKAHTEIMDKLLQDHKTARDVVHALDDANLRYTQGYHAAVKEIQTRLHQLIMLYPQHINIEDKQFFFPVMNYFTAKECDTMLQEFLYFDKNMIHELYSQLVEKQEKKYIENILEHTC